MRLTYDDKAGVRAVARLCVVATCTVLASSCGLVFDGSSSCQEFRLTSSTTANFEVSGDDVNLVVRQEGEPEVGVFSSTTDPSSNLMVSISATADEMSVDSPGVEAFVRRDGSAFAQAEVKLLGSTAAPSQCEAGGFVIDYLVVTARTGLVIGDTDYPIPAGGSSGGVFVQQIS